MRKIFMTQSIDSSSKINAFARDIAVGTISGVAATPSFYWIITCKVFTQLRNEAKKGGKELPKFPTNPFAYFKGMPGFAASFGPTIAIQTAAKGFFGNYHHPLFAAISAGCFSAIIVGPAELVMTQQQINGGSFFETAKNIKKFHGVQGFSRGMLATAMREGGSSGTILGAVPLLTRKFQDMGYSEKEARTGGSIIGGVIGASLSQPYDAIKTKYQSDLAFKESMIKTLQKTGGFSGLYWRIFLYIGASGSISYIQENLNKKI